MTPQDRVSADIDELRKRYRYDPKTGFLYRIATGRRVGARTGKTGYLCVWFNRQRIMVHRVVWAITHGEWPYEIDHINRNRADNRLENLRPASRVLQCRNTSVSKNNQVGVKGVCYCSQTGKYKATIFLGGKQIWLGRHSTIEEAQEARRNAEIEHWRDAL